MAEPARTFATDVSWSLASGALSIQPRGALRLTLILSAADEEPATNATNVSGGETRLGLGPRRCLIVEDANAPARAAAPPGVYQIDVSHARAGYRITGVCARELLSKSCPLDLHVKSFPAGACAQSLVADLPALLHAVEVNAIDVYFDRSYARSAITFLIEQAQEFEDGGRPSLFGVGESLS